MFSSLSTHQCFALSKHPRIFWYLINEHLPITGHVHVDESRRESFVVTVTNVSHNLMDARLARPSTRQALIGC